MGKGDTRTAKGKRFSGSYGKARPKKKAAAKKTTKAAPKKKPAAKKK